MVPKHRIVLRCALAASILSVGFYANTLRALDQPWPQWMDGRYGGPLSWAMFSDDVSRSIEIVASVSDGTTTTFVGRSQIGVGPDEWFFPSVDVWHIYAWFQSDLVNWTEVAALAHVASDLTGPVEVRFIIRERRSDGSGGIDIVDTPVPGVYTVNGNA